MDDRCGHGGEHYGAEEAEAVDRMVRPGGRQQMIDAREKDEDERDDDEFIAASRTSCEEETTEDALQFREEVELDELIESLDVEDSALQFRIRMWRQERGPVSVLWKVSKRWRAGLKKHIDVLRAEIARYEAHRVFLKETRDKVYNLRVSHFGEPYRSDY